MDTKKIMLYPKYFELSEDLTDEQFGRLLRAIGDFFLKNKEHDITCFLGEEKILYKMMKEEIATNFEKYEKMCENRRRAGQISAEKRREMQELLTGVDNNKNNNKNNNIYNNMNKNKNTAFTHNFGSVEAVEVVEGVENRPFFNEKEYHLYD